MCLKPADSVFYTMVKLTLEIRSGCPTSAPPCILNPQGDPPSKITSLAVMMH